MERLLSSLAGLLIIINASAQLFDSTALYLSTEVDMGNYLGMNANLNYVTRSGYSFQLGYSGHIRKPESQPKDYRRGLDAMFTLGISVPYDKFENGQLLAGRLIKLNTKGTIRLNLLGGIAYTSLREPNNWQPVENSFLTDNYTYEYRRKSVVSFILNPKVEFPFTRHFGLTCSALTQINKDRAFIGVGIGYMIGRL